MQKAFWTQGAKVSQESFAQPKPFLCTSATPFCTGAKDFLFAGSKTPVAPSPNHFWEFALFGQFPRSVASQVYFSLAGLFFGDFLSAYLALQASALVSFCGVRPRPHLHPGVCFCCDGCWRRRFARTISGANFGCWCLWWVCVARCNLCQYFSQLDRFVSQSLHEVFV